MSILRSKSTIKGGWLGKDAGSRRLASLVPRFLVVDRLPEVKLTDREQQQQQPYPYRIIWPLALALSLSLNICDVQTFIVHDDCLLNQTYLTDTIELIKQ